MDEAAPSPYGEAPEDEKGLKELALRVVKEDIEAGTKASEAMSSTRQEMYSLYRTSEAAETTDDETRPGRSRIKSSDVMDTIEWMMPSFMKAFCGGRDAIDVTPEGREDVSKATKNKKLLNWQFMNRCRGFLVLYELIKAGLVQGTSYAKITWQEKFVRKGFALPEVLEPQMRQMMADPAVESLTAGDVLEVAVPGAVTPNAVPYAMAPAQLETMRVYRNVKGEKRIVTYSGPRVEVPPPEEILMDPEAKTMEDAAYVIHKVRRTISYLREREREGVYTNISEVVRHATSDTALRSSEESSRYDAAEDSTLLSGGGSEQGQIARRKVEVYEWWGLLDVNGDGIADPYLVVMAGDTIIRMERNPYAHGLPPFVELRPILDIFRFGGIGISELVGEFQRVKTAIWRQTLDNMSFQNNGMWEVDENAGVDVDSLMRPRPGGIVFTNMLGKGFRPIAPPPLGNSPLQMMEFVQGQLEQRSGVTRYNQGLDASTLNKTAHGISAIMGASQQRLDLIARIMADSVRRIYKMMLELNQQFIDQGLVIRVFNEPLEISPDDLAGNFDVQVDIGGATGKEDVEVQRLLSVLQNAGLLLKLGVMRPQNIHDIVAKIMEVWGWRDGDKYLSDPQESEMLRSALMRIAQLGEMVQMGQMPPPEQVIEVLQGTYQILAFIVGSGGDADGQGRQQQQPMQGSNAGGDAPTVVLDPRARQRRSVGAVAGEGGYGSALQGGGGVPEGDA